MMSTQVYIVSICIQSWAILLHSIGSSKHLKHLKRLLFTYHSYYIKIKLSYEASANPFNYTQRKVMQPYMNQYRYMQPGMNQ